MRQRSSIIGGVDRWDYYNLKDKCLTEYSRKAAKNLRVIYLSESMLFAWKHSISKREVMQGKDDWLLQNTIHQLFYKAKMHAAVAYCGIRSHLIYTFKPMKMRDHCPLESDYVASCTVNEKTHLQFDRLELHGNFEREYSAHSKLKLDLIFRQVVE